MVFSHSCLKQRVSSAHERWHDLALKHILLCCRLRMLTAKGEVISFDGNLYSSLMFFNMMYALALPLTSAIHSLRHWAYNSPLIIG